VVRRIVIIGAGVVGAALADELTARGCTDVTVLDRGPLYATGGSSTHAPGLISRTSPSRMMQRFADHTIRTYAQLDLDGRPVLLPVGTLEIARNEDRLRELRRRYGFALAWGWQGRMIDADEAQRRWPIIDPGTVIGAYATDDEGLAVALRAVEALARRAIGRGARFHGRTTVLGIDHADGRVTGVRTTSGVVPADIAIIAAGVWGPAIAATTGLTLPTVAMEHQYAITTPIPALAANAGREATMPILRHHDAGLYFRDHGDRIGIGSFAHRRMPVPLDRLDDHERRIEGLEYAFTGQDFEPAWEAAVELLPALRSATLERRFNGVFSFTPDGYPLIGEHPELAGCWVAEAVWVTHSAGVARAVAELIVDGHSSVDVSPADLARFETVELTPAVYEARCDDSYRDVYVVHHPFEGHTSARDLRPGPFDTRERALGAVTFDVAGWERPRWYESNSRLAEGVPLPDRDEWASRYWSPIVAAEHRALRAGAGLVDMTSLTRAEVRGAGALSFLLRMIAGRLDRPVGSITYALILDPGGGIRSDVTVARLADDRFLVGLNGARDVAWLRSHLEAGDAVTMAVLTDSTGLLGLWGPAARSIIGQVADADVADDAFPYLTSQGIRVAGIPVVAGRISFAGELGWELLVANEDALSLWDALVEAGQAHGLVPVGHGALASLRLEKGNRAWGLDMTTEHGPDEAGLGWTVRDDGPDHLGREGLRRRRERPATRRLRTLILDGDQVAMGGEPILDGDDVMGYVASAAFGWSIGRSIAHAWVKASLAIGDRVDVLYLGRRLSAMIATEPLFDPEDRRIRS
jgi:glycine cleavage system aminomethyltransferase T/glycine/D-amino acid oxidase-like deaminating enzyme